MDWYEGEDNSLSRHPSAEIAEMAKLLGVSHDRGKKYGRKRMLEMLRFQQIKREGIAICIAEVIDELTAQFRAENLAARKPAESVRRVDRMMELATRRTA